MHAHSRISFRVSFNGEATVVYHERKKEKEKNTKIFSFKCYKCKRFTLFGGLSRSHHAVCETFWRHQFQEFSQITMKISENREKNENKNDVER